MSSSLLLSLSSKFSLQRSLGFRIQMFSSSSSINNNPYLLYCVTSSDGNKAGAMTKLHLFDPAKEENFVVGDKPLPEDIVDSRLVGSSKGFGVFFNTCPNYNSILISDFCNPSSSKSNPKIVYLHPRTRVKGLRAQIELVSGVAMGMSSSSSSTYFSPEAQDFIMGVKYTGRMLNIFKHAQGIGEKLRVIYTNHLSYDYFEHAKLMYSKRDQRFYMPSDGGHHLYSFDGLEDSDSLEFHELRFLGLSRFSQSELQLFSSCHRTQHLVESPSGQRFLIKWYAQILPYKILKFQCGGTKRFMVFREEEEEKNRCYTYTEDIGDLCIFLGNTNEPFCVQASLFPGLKPNSIYFLGEGIGFYDIATRTLHDFNSKSASAFSDLPCGLDHWVPHWLPPFPLSVFS